MRQPEQSGSETSEQAAQVLGADYPLLILYGSQTGTAEDCAERVGREAQRRHFSKVSVMSCDEYSMRNIFDEKLILFFIATTGQGDQPDNMRKFFRTILSKKLQPGDFGHLKFAVCGLGDSSYQKFNFSAKKVYRRLIQLGAQAIVDPVWADEQHDLGVDGLIDPWLEEFWKASTPLTKYPFIPPMEETMPPAKYLLEDYIESKQNVAPVEAVKTPSSYLTCPVLSHERVTAEDHFQDVKLMRIKLNEDVDVKPGDVAVILPKNTVEKVEECLNLFAHIEADRKVVLRHGATRLPPDLQTDWTTFRLLATNHFDLNYIPKRSFFSVYKHFCTEIMKTTEDSEVSEQVEQYWEKLDEFSKAVGQPDLVDYAIRPKRTVLEVLGDFPVLTARLKLQDLLTLIPGIRPRYYSIANSLLMYPNEVHILYAVVEFKTMLKKPRTGLCTQYLKSLRPGDNVQLYIRKGTLQFPAVTCDPPQQWKHRQVVMIGPGTGVAPFRALIQEFATGGGAKTPMVLFFGCRNSEKDYYFVEEWRELEGRNILRVETAFSREQEHKVYVQHRIRDCRDDLLKFVEDEDSLDVYICGNAARMVGDVLDVLREIWTPQRVETMQNKKRIQVEAWA